MAELTVYTNNVPREVIHAWELSEKERKGFDYLDWEAIDHGEDSREFFRYKGQLYDLDKFRRVASGFGALEEFRQWDEYLGNASGGLLIRWPQNSGKTGYDHVVVGWYCSLVRGRR